jgi:hypothetical protein
MQKSERLALVCIEFQRVFMLKTSTAERQQLTFQEHAKEV